MLAAAVLVAAGCARQFPDETAEIAIDGRTIRFELEACGLDDDTVLLLGRTGSGDVLQAVVGVEAADDERRALPEASGLTFSDEAIEWRAFGDLAWSLRGEAGEPPGEIDRASVDGSHVEIHATVVPTGGGGGSQRLDVRLDARCDGEETA